MLIEILRPMVDILWNFMVLAVILAPIGLTILIWAIVAVIRGGPPR